ncbi:flagellar basal body rod protein FlgB [Sediminibacillus dalangtanensis]|uniref:Flagellar basal body rod protein FlgB n=1 Tax=Sediminibacillus dalangtanensis TaxID=2729421 RepID=A0ABX7VSC4_9BACI|nr:flagellar basal body rod protein FlgB [Sediminibacillus dalangtanensis]QTM99408.1 flagellar basal body rod protein FlgB [Sediminibacillus dalangtanensis]
MSFFGNTISNLEKSLDYASLKNQTISNNIANADTPGYKAQQVAFKDVLNSEMNNGFQTKRTDARHIDFGSDTAQQSFRIVSNTNTTYNHNGNNVDIDKEMTELAKNQIYYQGLVDRLNGKFSSLQTVIKGGR